MLAYHHKPVSLSLISTDLPIWSTLETAATLYQKDSQRFHLLLNESSPPRSVAETETEANSTPDINPLRPNKNRLLWLEISPYRVIMTMQGQSCLGYRHFWEKGIYGMSRYWLHGESAKDSNSFRLRNFTYNLHLEGRPLPHSLRVEYELWSDSVNLGSYVLHLEIQH